MNKWENVAKTFQDMKTAPYLLPCVWILTADDKQQLAQKRKWADFLHIRNPIKTTIMVLCQTEIIFSKRINILSNLVNISMQSIQPYCPWQTFL